MGFDGAYTLKNWGVSWLLLPGISNWKAAELTDHFSSTFLIGLTWVTEVVPSANVMAQEHPYLGTVKEIYGVCHCNDYNLCAMTSSTYIAERVNSYLSL